MKSPVSPIEETDSTPISRMDLHRVICRVCWLGRLEYAVAWQLQNSLAAIRAQALIPDTLLLLEHPPTYTLGRRSNEAHLLVSREALAQQGIAVFHVDRGGDITFHGPGQLVGYPIMDLKSRQGGVSRYLRALEEILIGTLSSFGVTAGRKPGFTGVWIEDEKIAAIGVKLNAQRISTHGFALNVATDLKHFDRIIPCGIHDKGVTSLHRVLGRSVPLVDVVERVTGAFEEVLGMKMMPVPFEKIISWPIDMLSESGSGKEDCR